MVDLKYTQHRASTIAKLHTSLSSMKVGETKEIAELVHVALVDGFSAKTVYDVIQNYEDLGIVVIKYKDGRPFTVKKPEGTEVHS